MIQRLGLIIFGIGILGTFIKGMNPPQLTPQINTFLFDYVALHKKLFSGPCSWYSLTGLINKELKLLFHTVPFIAFQKFCPQQGNIYDQEKSMMYAQNLLILLQQLHHIRDARKQTNNGSYYDSSQRCNSSSKPLKEFTPQQLRQLNKFLQLAFTASYQLFKEFDQTFNYKLNQKPSCFDDCLIELDHFLWTLYKTFKNHSSLCNHVTYNQEVLSPEMQQTLKIPHSLILKFPLKEDNPAVLDCAQQLAIIKKATTLNELKPAIYSQTTQLYFLIRHIDFRTVQDDMSLSSYPYYSSYSSSLYPIESYLLPHLLNQMIDLHTNDQNLYLLSSQLQQTKEYYFLWKMLVTASDILEECFSCPRLLAENYKDNPLLYSKDLTLYHHKALTNLVSLFEKTPLPLRKKVMFDEFTQSYLKNQYGIKDYKKACKTLGLYDTFQLKNFKKEDNPSEIVAHALMALSA